MLLVTSIVVTVALTILTYQNDKLNVRRSPTPTKRQPYSKSLTRV